MLPNILHIPKQMPITPLFDKIEGVHDLRRLKPAQLPQLAYELRLALLYSFCKILCLFLRFVSM